MKSFIIALFIAAPLFGISQFKNNTDCDNPDFSSTTGYTIIQKGFKWIAGAETGRWQGEADSRFSFFGGLYLGKYKDTITKTGKIQGNSTFALYEKTQVRIVPNFLYAVASPEIVDFNHFEFRAGLRITLPLTQKIGIGIEPGYAFVSKAYYSAVNIHIAFD